MIAKPAVLQTLFLPHFSIKQPQQQAVFLNTIILSSRIHHPHRLFHRFSLGIQIPILHFHNVQIRRNTVVFFRQAIPKKYLILSTNLVVGNRLYQISIPVENRNSYPIFTFLKTAMYLCIVGKSCLVGRKHLRNYFQNIFRKELI